MKKLYFLLLFTGIVAKAQIVNIPDANFKAKLISSNLDINGDGEIQVSEAINATYLDVTQSNITDMTGIEAFTSLTTLTCFGNQLTTLNVSNSPNLQTLYCNYNQLATLNINGLTNLQILNCNNNNLTSLDVSNMTNLTYLSCTSNQISSLNVSGLTSLTYLDCFINQISAIDINSSINLTDLNCGYNQITSLNITSLNNLVNFNCSGNQLTTLNVNNLTALQKLICNNNYLTSLDATALTNLTLLDCSYNQLNSINLSGLLNLEILICGFNNISTLNLTGINNLKHLDFEHCQITSINLTNLTSLEILNAYNNQLTSLNVNNLINLKNLSCTGNQLTSLNIDSLINLESLVCSFTSITTLNTSNSPNLKSLICTQNHITSLDLSNNNNLIGLNCSINQLTSLDVTNLTQLQSLICGNNAIPNVNFSGLTQLNQLWVDSTGRTSLDVSNLPLLRQLICNSNPIPVIDVSNSLQLDFLSCGGPNLTQVFMKNGINESYFGMIQSPNLQFVCGDAGDLSQIQTAIGASGSSIAVATSYCTFVPGGNYNTITGTMTFDADNNGCDASDDKQSNIRVNINDGTTIGASFTNNTGNYKFYTQAGNFDITPDVDNPTWFNFLPATAIIPFANNNNNTVTQDFCITANGIHSDIEVVIAPIGAARPGFNARYQVVYKNKGNQTLSGNVNFSYNDAILDFVSSDVIPTSQSTGSLNYDYTNLLPFENRSFYITLHVNAPTDTPAVNIGNVLNFTATVNPIATDEIPSDNTFQYHQTVVGSFDPNDITCIEGNVVPPAEIGNYLHYIINFENTGTADAQNIVVRDVIDTTQFDVNSLQVLNSSDAVTAKLTGNIAEFIFQNINLHSGGHGNILIKIKSKDTLVQGETVSKRANIYFDYNAPIDTNLENTTFQALSNPAFEVDASILVYPNPTKGNVNISCDNTIKSVQLYDVQGRLLQTSLVNENQTTVDISNQSSGVYFLKIISDKGMKVQKIVRE